MKNRRHSILDDAWEMKAENLGGAVHTFRVGLVTNTVIEALPVVIEDVLSLAVEKPVIDHTILAKDLPVLLHFQTEDLMLAILVVYSEEDGSVQCYPFNNLNDGGYWWLYEMGFDITKEGFIEIRPIHPLMDEIDFEPTEGMMSHVEALATLVGSFIHRLQAGEISVVEKVEDFSKINKKRAGKGKEPIVNDWVIEYVQ